MKQAVAPLRFRCSAATTTRCWASCAHWACQGTRGPSLASAPTSCWSAGTTYHQVGTCPRYVRMCLLHVVYATFAGGAEAPTGSYRLLLNSAPFPYAMHGHPTTFQETESVLFEDVSEDSLRYLLRCKT